MRRFDGSVHKLALAVLYTCFAFTVRLDAVDAPDAAHSGPNTSVDSEINARRASRGYCGIYCLYTAMRILGADVIPESLLKPEYVGSVRGSTLSELQRAAEDKGIYAVPVGKLTIRLLQECPAPVILHVKDHAAASEYNHYELFLGMDRHKAKLLNPPEPVRLVPLYELATRWDGNALILSGRPIHLAKLLMPATKRFVLSAAGIVALVTLIRAGNWLISIRLRESTPAFLGLAFAQGAALTVVALVCGLLWHFTSDEGLIDGAQGVKPVQQAHAGNFLPRVTSRAVRRLLDDEAVFIDARYSRDYEAGHLRGAISVPVDTNDVYRHKITASLARDSRIVVYCQSRGCQFAEGIALWLRENGFSNVALYRGGWVDWVARNSKNSGEVKS